MIEFVHVTRRYGAKTAVNDLNLTIPDGELLALLGPNGAGKTTAIKMLVGLLRPTQGMVLVCGQDVVQAPREAQRLLSYVPDEPLLYDKLTGREFLRFIANVHALEPARAEARIEAEIERFSLAGFIDDLAESYSHGMKQRVVFAAALLHDPAVLVVDEPMVGLDPHSVRLVKDLLRAQAQAGTTIFLSTHTLAVAEEIADRIGVISNGRIIFLGTLEELRAAQSAGNEALEALYLELFNEQSREPADAVNSAPPALRGLS